MSLPDFCVPPPLMLFVLCSYGPWTGDWTLCSWAHPELQSDRTSSNLNRSKLLVKWQIRLQWKQRLSKTTEMSQSFLNSLLPRKYFLWEVKVREMEREREVCRGRGREIHTRNASDFIINFCVYLSLRGRPCCTSTTPSVRASSQPQYLADSAVPWRRGGEHVALQSIVWIAWRDPAAVPGWDSIAIGNGIYVVGAESGPVHRRHAPLLGETIEVAGWDIILLENNDLLLPSCES